MGITRSAGGASAAKPATPTAAARKAAAAFAASLAIAMALALAAACAAAPQRALAQESREAGGASLAAGALSAQDDGAATIVAEGYCTANADALWTLDSEGTLTFSLKEGATSTIIGGTNAQGPSWANDIEWDGTYRGKGVTSGRPSASDVKHVVVSNGITGVKHGYFSHLRELETASLPEGMTEMTSLFQTCTSLESVNIPSTVKTMYCCFVNCESLKTVELASGSMLASIGSESFQGCSSLESFDMPKSVVSVGSCAFKSCTALKSVSWPEGCACIPNLCFAGCRSLVSFDCPNGVTRIEGNAFKGCSLLERVSIPDSVTDIVAAQEYPKNGSFNGCTALKEFSLGADSHFVFEGGKLTRKADGIVVFDMANADPQVFGYSTENKNIEDLHVGVEISSFDAAAFMYCYDIRSISVEDGNQYCCVGGDGCLYTKDMTELVKAPNTLASYEPPTTLVRVCPYAFQGCSGLQAVDFSQIKGLDRLEEGCFNDCAALTEVKLPDCVTYIGAGAFAGTAIESFRVPAQLWAGHEADYQSFFCYDATVAQRSPNGAGIFFSAWSPPQGPARVAPVKEVDLSAYGRTFIPPYMFGGLDKLERVTIPSSVTTLETGAFYGCSSLEDVTCYSQSLSIAGAGMTGDSTLGWSAATPPAFGGPSGDGDKYATKTDIAFHGLAYSESDLLAYCKAGGGTFSPIVYLGGMSDGELAATFGDPQGWDDYSAVSCTFADDGELGSGLGLTAAFLDDAIDPRSLSEGSDFTAVCTDASGDVVSDTGAPGAYTLTVTGNGSDVLGTATYKFTRWGSQTISGASSFSKVYGEPAFSLGAKASAGGELTYSTSNLEVATVDADGKVTVKGVGAAEITVKAAQSGCYRAAAKTVTVEVAKAANALTVKPAKAVQKVKFGKKKSIKAAKAFKVVANASKGAVSYKKVKGNKKITVTSKGKVVVKKGLKKGTYTVRVRAASKATGNYDAASVIVKLKVKVK